METLICIMPRLMHVFWQFLDISRKAKDLGICPYTGKWEALSSNMKWMAQTYAIFIEDPFEQPVNAARTVKPSLMRKISEAFQTTYRRVSSTYQTEASLLPGLARPRVLKALGRTPPGAGSHGGNHDRVNCSVVSNVTSSSQVQQQFQNMSLQHQGMVQKSLTRGDRFQGESVPTLEPRTYPVRLGSQFVEPGTDLVDPRKGSDRPAKKHRPICTLLIFLSLVFFFNFFLS